jgi:hypothetical protein
VPLWLTNFFAKLFVIEEPFVNSQIKQAMITLAAAILLVGCHKTHPTSSTQSSMAAPTTQAVAADDPNAGVVAKKPFIATSHWLGVGAPAAPSVLLQQHARSDSPIPLSQYSNQPTHSLGSFDLRANLSAAELEKRIGLPAQLADYSSPWLVYRLAHGRELWLHFSQPDQTRLLAADEIIPVEDGYTRKSVFSIDNSH